MRREWKLKRADCDVLDPTCVVDEEGSLPL